MLVQEPPQRISSPRGCFVFDIDGTLALSGDRKMYDWSRVGEDQPNIPVIRVAQALSLVYPVVKVSGRMDTDDCRELTVKWLVKHGCDHGIGMCLHRDPLFMRGDGDYRPDDVVKREFFELLTDMYGEVHGVFDDRPKVIRMWRDLPLTCFDVAGKAEF